MEKYHIRKLEFEDLIDYKAIRLELLQSEPMNFGSSFEEESMFDETVWKNRLIKAHIIPLGAFVDSVLVGIVLVVMNPRKKMLHVATINSMYVKEEYRGLGIGNALIEEAILMSRRALVEILNLSVVTTNISAYSLYKKHGFVEYGEEKNTIKYNGNYSSLFLMRKEL